MRIIVFFEIIYFFVLSYANVTLVVTCTPPMLNPSEFSLNLQVAVKNIATNAVFYFGIPVSMEALFTPNATMDVNTLASTWKGLDESLEVSQIVNGNYCCLSA